ncbi:hypothetical protein DFAR_4000018 [Desulfarculales bacterium]
MLAADEIDLIVLCHTLWPARQQSIG